MGKVLGFRSGSGSDNRDEETTTGIPAGNRGQGPDNKGRSIREWRAGRGPM